MQAVLLQPLAAGVVVKLALLHTMFATCGLPCGKGALWFYGSIVCFSVSERSNVSKRNSEVSNGNRWCQRQSVRGAVCQPFHPHHDAAQTGNTCTFNILL